MEGRGGRGGGLVEEVYVPSRSLTIAVSPQRGRPWRNRRDVESVGLTTVVDAWTRQGRAALAVQSHTCSSDLLYSVSQECVFSLLSEMSVTHQLFHEKDTNVTELRNAQAPSTSRSAPPFVSASTLKEFPAASNSG